MRMFLVLLFSTFTVSAQYKDHVLKHYTDSYGLPQNSVNGIVTDARKYMWLVTQDGLVRFDGNRFVIYNKNNIQGLLSNRFTHFRRDVRGQLYAVNELFQYIDIGGQKIFVDKRAAADINRSLAQMGFQRNKTFWVRGTLDDGYVRPFEPEYLFSVSGTRFIKSAGDNLYFYEDERMVATVKFQSQDRTRFFMFDQELYYLDTGGGLVRLDSSGSKACILGGDIRRSDYFEKHPDSVSICWNSLFPFTLLYCGRSFYILERSRTGDVNTRLLYSDVDIKPGEITSIYFEPHYRRLFIGSSTNGFYMITPGKFRVLVSSGQDEQNVYYAHTPLDTERVITGDGQVLGIGKNNVFRAAQLAGSADRYGILTDRWGSIWKKERTRLIRYNPQLVCTGQWHFQNEISNIYNGGDSMIWISAGSTLWRMPVSGALAVPEQISTLPGPSCYMQGGSDGSMWIGTGVGLFLLQHDRLTSINGLKGKYIRSLYLRNDQELWITTYEDGIYHYGNGRLTHLPSDRDNYLKAAHCIVEDKDDFFWITTNKGLFHASRTDLLRYTKGELNGVYYHYYDQGEGLLTNEFNGGCQPCGLMLENGTISLPSLNGLVWFNPRRFKDEYPVGPISIDYVLVDQKISAYEGNLLKLPRGFGQLKVRLSVPYYGNVHNVQMQYAMLYDGVTSQWYNVDKSNEITITDLKSGSYMIMVRKRNGFGRNNFSTLLIRLVVPPAFYETGWFYALALLLFGLCIYFYIRLRLKYVVGRNKELEIQVARRTSHLDNALQKLTLSELKLKQQARIQEKIVAAIGHDIRSPLKFVVLANQKIYEDLMVQNNERALHISKEAFQAANRTYQHIDNFVEFVRVQMQQGEIMLKPVSLSAAINAKLDFFSIIARDKAVSIVPTIPQDITVLSEPQLLAVIIHNILDNAIKYGKNGNVRIYTIDEGDDDLQLVIADEGGGIDQSLVDWLNDVQNDHIPDTPQTRFRGLGLLMVKELCAVLKIHIRVVSVGSGTQFRLRFNRYKAD